MGLADIIVVFLLTYYSIHIVRMMFNKKKRVVIQQTNIDIDKLRKKPFKSLEEQKQFLNLKYPKGSKFKWQWKIIPNVLFSIILYIVVFRSLLYLWDIIGIQLRLWHSIIIIILFPMAINYILEKFNIQKSDLRYLLRW